MYAMVSHSRDIHRIPRSDFNAVASRVLHKRIRIVMERIDILSHLITYMAEHHTHELRKTSGIGGFGFLTRGVSDASVTSTRGSFILSPPASSHSSATPTPSLSPTHAHRHTSSTSSYIPKMHGIEQYLLAGEQPREAAAREIQAVKVDTHG